MISISSAFYKGIFWILATGSWISYIGFLFLLLISSIKLLKSDKYSSKGIFISLLLLILSVVIISLLNFNKGHIYFLISFWILLLGGWMSSIAGFLFFIIGLFFLFKHKSPLWKQILWRAVSLLVIGCISAMIAPEFYAQMGLKKQKLESSRVWSTEVTYVGDSQKWMN